MKIEKEIQKIIDLMEKAKTIDDGNIGFALIKLYVLKKKFPLAHKGEKQ